MTNITPGAIDDSARDVCTGRGTANGGHCCWVAGEECRFLVFNPEGSERRFECSLRRELGSWEAVHADPEYQKHVQAVWDGLGIREDGTPVIDSCGSWQPDPGICCLEER